jgi:opacity protein-like surface antigen
VTAELVSIGDFTQPTASNALMISAGGGIQAPIAPHMALDVGYRLSHIAVATPVNAQSVVFGFEYQF